MTEETYEATTTCPNCGSKIFLEIPKRKPKKIFMKEEEVICDKCLCEAF